MARCGSADAGLRRYGFQGRLRGNTYLNANLSRKPTAEEAANEGVDGAPPAKEPSAKLPMEQMRDLSGPWMTSMWYTVLNMGPRGSLPTQQPQMHGVKDPEAPVPSLLTPWAKAIAAKYSMYTDPVLTCNSPGPQAYAAPYAFEVIPSPGRLNMLMEYYHVVRRIYMDGRATPKGNPDPNAIGHSIGHGKERPWSSTQWGSTIARCNKCPTAMNCIWWNG